MDIKTIFKNKWIRVSTFLVLGAIAGYSYYYFIGCATNACPITSNPYISSAYGMMIGLLLSFDSKKKQENKSKKQGE